MTETLPPARVLRALTSDHQIRFTALNAGPLWDGVRRGHPWMEAQACACLVELLSAALLLQSRTFFSERLQLMVRSAGRARVLVADSWPDGDIRGLLDPSGAPADVPWIQGPGSLSVMRSNPKGQPYIGALELDDRSIQAQIEAYLLQSEQVRASVTLWCDPGSGEGGALLVEPLPNCSHERLDRLVQAIEGLEVVPLGEREPEFLCRWIGQGSAVDVLSTMEIRYRCRCNREGLAEILRGFEAAKQDEIFHGEPSVEVHCDYCGQAYQIQRDMIGQDGDGTHVQS